MLRKFFAVCFILFNCICIAAQIDSPLTGIRIIPKRLARVGDSVYVRLNVEMSNVNMNSDKSLDVIPVLSNGDQIQNLPKISIKGRFRYMDYYRFLALMTEKEKSDYFYPYVVERGYNNDKTIHYIYKLPYREWMSSAYMVVQFNYSTSRTEYKKISIQPLANKILNVK